MAKAIFTDGGAGQVAMTVETVATKRRGVRVTAYRWASATGKRAGDLPELTFSSEAAAVAMARRHALFSQVEG